MATLKEMLAAKKAAAAGLVPIPSGNASVIIDVGPSPTDDMITGKTPQEFLDIARKIVEVPAPETSIVDAMDFEGTVSVPIKSEAASPAPIKGMTFAEKMALKKAEATAKANNETSNGQLLIQATEANKKPVEITLSEEQKEVLAEIEDAEMAQAYSDIALKINFLSTTSTGEPLGNAMAELKKALHKNPSASMMLLDTDIGQMTIALRRYTHVELAEAATDKATKKASKVTGKAATVVLTPEMLAAQFSDF